MPDLDRFRRTKLVAVGVPLLRRRETLGLPKQGATDETLGLLRSPRLLRVVRGVGACAGIVSRCFLTLLVVRKSLVRDLGREKRKGRCCLAPAAVPEISHSPRGGSRKEQERATRGRERSEEGERRVGGARKVRP